jgi:hypothetical protein
MVVALIKGSCGSHSRMGQCCMHILATQMTGIVAAEFGDKRLIDTDPRMEKPSSHVGLIWHAAFSSKVDRTFKPRYYKLNGGMSLFLDPCPILLGQDRPSACPMSSSAISGQYRVTPSLLVRHCALALSVLTRTGPTLPDQKDDMTHSQFRSASKRWCRCQAAKTCIM